MYLAKELSGNRPDADDRLDMPVKTDEFDTRHAQFDIESIQGQAVAIGREARATVEFYGDIIIRHDTLEDLPPVPGEPPYKGLTYFTEADQDIFFGREASSDELVTRLRQNRFLAVIGASGDMMTPSGSGTWRQ